MGSKINAYRGGSATEAKKDYEVTAHNLVMSLIFKKIIEMRGLTEEEAPKIISEKTGASRRMIEMVRDGHRSFSKPLAEKVAKALNVPMPVLFVGRVLNEEELRVICGLFQAIERGRNDPSYQKIRDSILQKE